MTDRFESLRELKGVKNVKNFNDSTIKIELFSREIGDSGRKEIRGDLRSISQRISGVLNDLKSENGIKSWKWVEKPEKKYQETSLGNSGVSDRKSKGYSRGYYRVLIRED